MGTRSTIVCNECGHRFKRTIGPNTFEIRCPKCRGYDTEPDMMAEIYTFLREEGIREIGVTVVDTNTSAIRFYEQHGFGKRYVYLWGDVPEVD